MKKELTRSSRAVAKLWATTRNAQQPPLYSNPASAFEEPAVGDRIIHARDGASSWRDSGHWAEISVWRNVLDGWPLKSSPVLETSPPLV